LARGYRLLPDPSASLPEAATPMIDAALGQAELSIHLLGDEAETGDNIAMRSSCARPSGSRRRAPARRSFAASSGRRRICAW